MELLNGDCMELLPNIPDNSVDLVLCDLPYGTTDCKWDKVLPMDELWKEYRRLLKCNGVAALFSAQPFTTTLINSNRQAFRYCWYWVKNTTTGYAYARYQPMRKIEEVAVFVCNVPGRDNTGKHKELREYMREELRASGHTRAYIDKLLGNCMSSHYFTGGGQFTIPTREQWEKIQAGTGRFSRSWEDVRKEYEREIGREGTRKQTYNPQGIKIAEKQRQRRKKAIPRGETAYKMDTLGKAYTTKYTNWPQNVLYFNTERGLHPTQKPVPLLEYLVKTYTNPGDTVLDNCMGSGSTAIACMRTGRHFIGMEKDPKYFQTALKRVNAERDRQ